MSGGIGNDSLYGGDGNDTLDGGAGNDYLYGDRDLIGSTVFASADTIYGGAGDDFIYGGGGADLMSGDGGVNRLDGGAGNDIYVHQRSLGGQDTIMEGASNGASDLLVFNDVLFSSLFAVADPLNSNDLRLRTSTSTTDFVQIRDYFASGSNTVEFVQDSSGAVYDIHLYF
ncbi:calcium-binding protein [Roseomonas sp. 18066]|uniref:calcium-binding protein n=1 Tax=Roseomonas sp. 18066 TaxID=2681412 RepID=UPI00190F64DE|nr:hypothetical protein [Roseomonas sp. 18066]